MEKIDIAIHQLNKAIELFLDEKDYICCITLTGAAEEILGKELLRRGLKPASKSLAEILKEKYEKDSSVKHIRDKHLNKIRNAIKHFNDEKEFRVNTNWQAQSIQMLARGCLNFYKLNIKPTKQINRFFDWMDNYENSISG